MAIDIGDQTRRFYKEVMDNRNLAVLDEMLAPGFIDHEIEPEMNMPEGIEGVREWIRQWQDAFTDGHVEIQDVIVQGDKVVARVTMHGTHTGEFMGIEPTGARIAVKTIDILRFEGDRAAEHWGVTDIAGLLMQLGVLEPPAS